METRQVHTEEKYPSSQSPLKFLQRAVTEPQELALKADLLIEAISNKDVTFVKEILASPGDATYINFRSYKTCAYDPKTNHTVQKGYSGESNTAYPKTALTLAAYLGLTDIVLLLIKHGADVNLSSQMETKEQNASYQYSPLEYAVHHRKSLGFDAASIEEYQEITKILKKNGADVHPSIQKLDSAGLLSDTSRASIFFHIKKDPAENVNQSNRIKKIK